MSFIMFLVVGLSVGLMIYAISYRRLPVGGVVGAVAGGVVAAFAGGLLGAAVAGAPLTQIRPATVAGTAFGAYATVAIVAGAIHYRRVHGSFAPLLRRIRRS
ncbi:MAG TPA: hypothetical protein VM686_38685 [Polyangiaceae bacterium]|nr:hypothetical protein [Polyangiaceae bacterium]